MSHTTTPKFWEHYRALPPKIQKSASRSFAMLQKNPHHPSLHLKRTEDGKTWSARVSKNYRAVGRPKPDGIIWVWIGPHDEYERLLKQ
ncbi:MAG: hypothetical protein HAW59_01320 [Betaproteobacteria bacterium]|nr:hypothetical protein [Betaproteobacteria bacterium]